MLVSGSRFSSWEYLGSKQTEVLVRLPFSGDIFGPFWMKKHEQLWISSFLTRERPFWPMRWLLVLHRLRRRLSRLASIHAGPICQLTGQHEQKLWCDSDLKHAQTIWNKNVVCNFWCAVLPFNWQGLGLTALQVGSAFAVLIFWNMTTQEKCLNWTVIKFRIHYYTYRYPPWN